MLSCLQHVCCCLVRFVLLSCLYCCLSTIYLQVPMRNFGTNQRRSPWVCRNNGNTVCINGISLLMTPMKDAKVATSPNKRPKAEAKPSVRAQAKALLACTAIYLCYACVRNCRIFCPVVIVTYYELIYTGTCQQRPGLCHYRQFVRCGA